MVCTPPGVHKVCVVKPGVVASLFRTTKIRFYPTIFSTFCFLAELGAQKGPKMGSERPSADRFQAVSDTIEGSPLFRKMDTFRPPIAPSTLHIAGNGRRNH